MLCLALPKECWGRFRLPRAFSCLKLDFCLFPTSWKVGDSAKSQCKMTIFGSFEAFVTTFYQEHIWIICCVWHFQVVWRSFSTSASVSGLNFDFCLFWTWWKSGDSAKSQCKMTIFGVFEVFVTTFYREHICVICYVLVVSRSFSTPTIMLRSKFDFSLFWI